MAEMVAAAMSAVASIAPQAATVATAAPMSLAPAATSAASVFSLSSPWLTALQIGATGLGALSGLAAGEQKAAALTAQATDAEIQSDSERIAGTERRAGLKAAAAEQMAERQAAYAAGGVDLSFGTPVTAKAQDLAQAERALAIDQGNEDINRARLLEKANSYRLAAKEARRGAMIGALTKGVETSIAFGRRGGFPTI